MSQENVETVRLRAAYRGEWEQATAVPCTRRGLEVGRSFPSAGPGPLSADMWRRWNDEWDRLDMIGDEIIDAGEKVFVPCATSGRGRRSGVDDRPVGVRGVHSETASA